MTNNITMHVYDRPSCSYVVYGQLFDREAFLREGSNIICSGVYCKFSFAVTLVIERRRRENRGAEGAEGVRFVEGLAPPQTTRWSGGAS